MEQMCLYFPELYRCVEFILFKHLVILLLFCLVCEGLWYELEPVATPEWNKEYSE